MTLNIKSLQVHAGDKCIINDFTHRFLTDRVYAIMGPNGSGKSTLAHTIMGNPQYTVTKGSITYDRCNLLSLDVAERAKLGIFLGFQHPPSLTGVNVTAMLIAARPRGKTPLQISKLVKQYASELGIKPDLLSRGINEGASGGERKKLEVLQAAVLDARIQIFDEIDTGVDIDSLKTIAKFIDDHRARKCIVLITHYNRLLRHIAPDEVIVMKDSRKVKVGTKDLALEIESAGYGAIDTKKSPI